MNEEIEFLESIYQNVKFTQESIARIIKMRDKNDELDSIIKQQYLEYKKISNSAKAMIERRKKKVKEVGVMTKIATYVGIKANMLNGEDISQIALMLVEGSKVGTEQLNRYMKEYNVTNKNIINLANRLLNIEKDNIQKLQKFI